MTYKLTRDSKGFSLIEVLIALVVLSLTLLGLSSLQRLSLKATQQAHFRTQATLAVTNLSEKMRANPTGVALGAYQINYPIECSKRAIKGCINRPCSPAKTAYFDLYSIYCGNGSSQSYSTGLNHLLPNPKLTVTCDTLVCSQLSEHTIKISWLDRQHTTESDKASVTLAIIP